MVGTGRFELPTCRLGGDRSIHLSYVPAIFVLLWSYFVLYRCRAVAFQSFAADVCAVVHAFEVDQARGDVGVVYGGREVMAGGGDAEYAASGGFECCGILGLALARSRLEDGGAGGFRGVDSMDRLAGRESAGIALRCEDHAD